MKRLILAVLASLLVAAIGTIAAGTLDIYFIDVDGGQSTLVVTPAGQSMLIDAGWSGNGNRDPDRIAAVAKAAGVTRLDYLLITHFHEDHMGGAAEVVKRLPVRTFVDYGSPVEKDEFALKSFTAYASVRTAGAQVHPKPGDRLPLNGVTIEVASAGGSLITTPLSGGGQPNTACKPAGDAKKGQASENQQSIGIRLTFGRFSFLDLGDLYGRSLNALVCPVNLLGRVDAFLVSHHGNDDSSSPAVPAAIRPRVAILNNGPRKGGDPEAFDTLRQAPGIEGVWQLHRTRNEGAQNFPDSFIANVDDGDKDAGHWIRLSASEDGSFTVTNGRTQSTVRYK